MSAVCRKRLRLKCYWIDESCITPSGLPEGLGRIIHAKQAWSLIGTPSNGAEKAGGVEEVGIALKGCFWSALMSKQSSQPILVTERGQS
jgi:hypothetical protein